MQCACDVTLRPVRLNVVALGKQYLLRCVSVAVIIRQATTIYRIMRSFVACLALSHFPTFFHNGTIFGENTFNVKVFAVNLCTNFETHLILTFRRLMSTIVDVPHR